MALSIRQEQLNRFNEAQHEHFTRDLAQRLHLQFPGCHGIALDALHSKTETGIAEGRTYGLSAEYDLERYVELLAECSWDLSSYPDAMQILTDHSLSGTVKMDRMDDWATFGIH